MVNCVRCGKETNNKKFCSNECYILHGRSAETREKARKSMLGKKHSEEAKKKISSSNLGRQVSDETKEKIRISLKGNEPRNKGKQMKSRNVKQNKAEKKLEDILNSLYPAEFKFVGDGQIIIFGKNPDFINVNGKKQIVELYGKYWHQNDNLEERELLFKQAGFKTLILWDYELKKFDEVSAKIKDFVGV